ncbi:unnamed protein product, partial [Allacma fusca]
MGNIITKYWRENNEDLRNNRSIETDQNVVEGICHLPSSSRTSSGFRNGTVPVRTRNFGPFWSVPWSVPV